MYQYNAIILSNYDADTLRVSIDLGLGVWKVNESIRLYGVDAPELTTDEGKRARDYVASVLPSKTKVVITTIKDAREKYGRYLAKVTLPDESDLAQNLIQMGFAVSYLGGARTIIPAIPKL